MYEQKTILQNFKPKVCRIHSFKKHIPFNRGFLLRDTYLVIHKAKLIHIKSYKWNSEDKKVFIIQHLYITTLYQDTCCYRLLAHATEDSLWDIISWKTFLHNRPVWHTCHTTRTVGCTLFVGSVLTRQRIHATKCAPTVPCICRTHRRRVILIGGV